MRPESLIEIRRHIRAIDLVLVGEIEHNKQQAANEAKETGYAEKPLVSAVSRQT